MIKMSKEQKSRTFSVRINKQATANEIAEKINNMRDEILKYVEGSNKNGKSN